MENLLVWLNSQDRALFRKKFADLVEYANVDVVEGASQLFSSPTENSDASNVDYRPPPVWKVFVLIFFTIYPLRLLSGYTLIPFVRSLGWSQFQAAAISFLVVLLTTQWIIHPIVFKKFGKWLKAPRPHYPRHSFMFMLDSGFSVFKPVNPDIVTPVQEALINRISIAETFIHNLQERLRLVEHRDGDLTVQQIEDAMKKLLPTQTVQDKTAHVMVEKLKKDAEERKTLGASSDMPVTIKLAIKVPSAFMKIYEEVNQDMGRAAAKFEGFLGKDVIRPATLDASGSGVYVSVTRFKTHEQLMKWLTSRERKELLLRIYPFVQFVDGEVESEKLVSPISGFDHLFVNLDTKDSAQKGKKTQGPPAKWKTFSVTYVLLLGSSQFSNYTIAPSVSHLPLPISTFILLWIAILMNVYLTNPMMNKFLQDWIHGYTADEVPKSGMGRCLHLGFPCL
jgi:antibiotic biosynthesis monooxygenase (ABM) superfamily enzyme